MLEENINIPIELYTLTTIKDLEKLPELIYKLQNINLEDYDEEEKWINSLSYFKPTYIGADIVDNSEYILELEIFNNEIDNDDEYIRIYLIAERPTDTLDGLTIVIKSGDKTWERELINIQIIIYEYKLWSRRELVLRTVGLDHIHIKYD